MQLAPVKTPLEDFTLFEISAHAASSLFNISERFVLGLGDIVTIAVHLAVLGLSCVLGPGLRHHALQPLGGHGYLRQLNPAPPCGPHFTGQRLLGPRHAASPHRLGLCHLTLLCEQRQPALPALPVLPANGSLASLIGGVLRHRLPLAQRSAHGLVQPPASRGGRGSALAAALDRRVPLLTHLVLSPFRQHSTRRAQPLSAATPCSALTSSATPAVHLGPCSLEQPQTNFTSSRPA